jgi:hypothetical protein
LGGGPVTCSAKVKLRKCDQKSRLVGIHPPHAGSKNIVLTVAVAPGADRDGKADDPWNYAAETIKGPVCPWKLQ